MFFFISHLIYNTAIPNLRTKPVKYQLSAINRLSIKSKVLLRIYPPGQRISQISSRTCKYSNLFAREPRQALSRKLHYCTYMNMSESTYVPSRQKSGTPASSVIFYYVCSFLLLFDPSLGICGGGRHVL
jgi:hypothetical protein